MARIAIFTYGEHIDRRALLECKSLIARGHEVELYALATQQNQHDPDFVRRMGKSADTTSNAFDIDNAAMPLSKQIYLALERVMPGLFPLIKPIGKPFFWIFYGVFYPNQTPWVFRLRDLLNKIMPRWFDAIKPTLRRIYWRIYQHNPASLYFALYKHTLKTLPDYDMIIAHDLPMLPVAAKAANQQNAILVYDSHELFAEQDYNDAERAMWMRLEAAHIHKAKSVITVNRSIAYELEKRYHLAHVDVIYNAEWIAEKAPHNQKHFHNFFALQHDVKIVLYQGGLPFGRNLDSMVAALQYVADKNIHLVVLGDGVMLGALQNIVMQHELEERVHFHPAVAQEKLLDYTASADLGIIPYTDNCLNNRYCTPNKLFEFIAAGLPMIATDLPEISRLLAKYQMGLVGDTSSPEQIAMLISRALIPETLATIKKQVLDARSEVNWQNEGEKFAAIIDKALVR